MNYWIFQCNPDAYQLSTAIEKGLLKEWNVKQHRFEIQEGDKAIIWVTGKNSGVYATANITSNPTQKFSRSEDNHLFQENNNIGMRLKEEDETGWRVNVDLMPNQPLYKNELRNISGLENFRAGQLII